jgi:nucleoside-diphosphate-sugar epimerase
VSPYAAGMRVAIAGGHGKIALLLGQMLAQRGDTVTAIVRNPDHIGDLSAIGVHGVVTDLEHSTVADVAAIVAAADAVVFAAGAGPGSGAARKDTVDRAAATLLADAAVSAGVRRYLLISSMGVESVRDGATPSGVDSVFVAYLRAKLAAEEDVLGRAELDPTVLRPGGLTDEPATGRVRLGPRVARGAVPRADVAAVVLGLIDRPPNTRVLELVSGDEPIAAALDRLSS